MKAIGKPARAVLALLTEGLELGDARVIKNCAAFMPTHVERIHARMYAVSHTYEQNGDLMRDPEVVFWLGPDDQFYPVSFHQDPYGLREYVDFGPDGSVERLRPKAQAQLASFCNTWMRNIKEQQGLRPRAAAHHAKREAV